MEESFEKKKKEFLRRKRGEREELYYTPSDIIRLTGRSKNTIYSWLKVGKVPGVKIVNGRKYINKIKFDNWWG